MAQFDSLAAAYAAFEASPFRRYLESHTVFEFVGDVRDRRVLDFGCGAGSYTRWLKTRGAARVDGLDVSSGMIDYARAREADAPLGITYHLGSLPPALIRSFDIVLSVYVLPYATTRDELKTLCATYASALRSGGRLITLPINPGFHANPDWYAQYGCRLYADRPLADGDAVTLEFCPPGHQAMITARWWSRETLDETLRDSGFHDIRWHAPVVSSEGDAEMGRAFWDNYLTTPHAMVIEAHT